MMHDLAHRPAAFAVRGVQLWVAQTLDRGTHFRWRRSNLLNRLLSPRGRHLRGHRKISNRVPRIHVVFSWSNLVFPCTISAVHFYAQCPPGEKALPISHLSYETPGGDRLNNRPLSRAAAA